MKPFALNVSGDVYKGTWAALSTEAIGVQCEYGTRSVFLYGRSPAEAALAMVTTMVPANAS